MKPRLIRDFPCLELGALPGYPGGAMSEFHDSLREAAAILARGGYWEEARVVHEARTRLRNASATIGAYQRLTATDYPGTLKSYIQLGRVVFPDPLYQPDMTVLAKPSCPATQPREER